MAATPKVFTPSAKVELGEDVAEKGIMICIKPGDGEAYKAADTSTYVVIGINDEIGDEGDDIVVKSGIFRFDNSGDVTQAHIGTPVYVEDETTVVVANPGNTVFAGVVVDVDANGVWVDNTPSAIAGCRSLLAVSNIVDLTDNSGGTGTDTLAAVTNVDTLSIAGLTEAADDTPVDIVATAGACAGAASPTAANVDTAIATAVASIVTATNKNFKEVCDQVVTQEAANTAIVNALSSLADKVNEILAIV